MWWQSYCRTVKSIDLMACVSSLTAVLVYRYYHQPYQNDILWHRMKLNNTISSDPSYLIFNRTPKTGSQTVRGIIRILSSFNGFLLYKGKDQKPKNYSERYVLSEESKRYHIDLWTGDMTTAGDKQQQHRPSTITHGKAYEGTWYDGKTGRLWGEINGTKLIWWDGAESKIIVDNPSTIRLPFANTTLKGYITGKGMLKWEDGSIWTLANHKLLRPFCYEKHMHFLDATEFNRTNPIYINMVRHPLDRILSWYYYARSPQYIYAEHSPTDIPDLKMMKRTFEECVINKSNDCIYPIGHYIEEGDKLVRSFASQIAFFCGMKPECRVFGSKEAMKEAKKNVEKYYAVVGVLEELEKSILVLEKFTPKYLDKASLVYKEMIKTRDADKHSLNKNIYKPKSIPKYLTRNLLQNFTLEMEFYTFCKARLHKQYISLL